MELRSITTDISPVINWCNSEYTNLDDIPFTEEDDNPEEYSLSVSASYELCNQFRETLKPIFKLLALKVDEIANEFENNDFISKSDLKREDTIDINGKLIDGKIHLEAEDTIVKELSKSGL